MIVRLIVVDPLGIRKDKQGRETDLLVYQVPENSREAALLKDLLTAQGIEFAEVSAPCFQSMSTVPGGQERG